MIRNWLDRMSVRLLLIVLVTTLPPLGIIVDTYFGQRTEAMAASKQVASVAALQVAERQRDMIDHARQLLSGLAGSPDIDRIENPRSCQDWLAKVAGLNELYADLFVARIDGDVVCRSQGFEGAINVSDRSYFRQIVAKREFSIGEYSFSRATGKPVVVFAQPVFAEDGSLSAVVGLGAPPAAFERLLRDMPLPSKSVVTVVDREGYILSRWPDAEGIAGQVIPELADFKASIPSTQPLVIESRWLDEVSRATVIVPVLQERNDLYVRVGVPTAMADAAATSVARHSLILLALMSASVWLVGWFASHHLIMRRVRDLSQTASRLGAGDLGARCRMPPSGGELGQLAQVLDNMAEHIQQSVQELSRAVEAVSLRNRAIDSSRNGIMIYRYGAPSPILSANPALLGLLHIDPEQLASTGLVALAERGFAREGWEQFLALLSARREGEVMLRLSRNDGQELWLQTVVTPVDDDEIGQGHAVVEFRDVTERQQYEEALAHQASHDPLTGLANRNLLIDRLEQTLVHGGRGGENVYVLWLDLDRFHVVYDSFGRRIADEALIAVGQRLTAAAPECSTVARVVRDEFVLVFEPGAGDQDAVSLANRLLDTLRKPIAIDENELCLTASIGIAVSSDSGGNAESLLRNANIATLRAKETGRDTFCFYDSKTNELASSRLRLELGLRRAIERDELSLVYQPKVDLLTGEVTGAEALCRWHSPELGEVPPSEFIAVAEGSGLIFSIGRWVLQAACVQMRQWLDSGVDFRRMAVNVSALQFYRDDLVAEVSGLVTRYRLDPGSLMLEITESTLMGDPERAIATMQRLKALGIRLAIDDFGTGYSSLSTLKRFPIDYLKIDRAFISDLTTNPSDAAIAVSVISLAHSLNLRVIAEGVETEGQLLYLRGRACDEMQGYFYSRPVSAERLAGMINERQWLEFPIQKDLPQRTLLLVDDERSVQAALRRLLRREGYTLLFAADAAEAFDLLTRNTVGVVISDYRMPGMDGILFLDKVRGLYPQTVRIVLSGYSDINVITNSINRSAIFRFLHKPWDDRELMEAIRDAFEHFELGVAAHA